MGALDGARYGEAYLLHQVLFLDAFHSYPPQLFLPRLSPPEWRANGHKVEEEYSLLRNDIDFKIVPPVLEGNLIGMSCGACFGMSVLQVMVGLATTPKV